MSAHESCQHPKTKSARAACRRAQKSSHTSAPAVKIETPAAMTVTATADEERRIKVMNFEKTECGRCDGTGRYGPLSVAGGVCFSCAGKKTKITKKGERARNESDRLMDERMSAPLSDLKPGDVVWAEAAGWAGFKPINYPYKWRTIKSISEPRVSAYSITKDEEGNEVRTPVYNVTVTFESIAGQEERTNTPGGSSPEEIAAKTYRRLTEETRETTQQIMKEIVRRFSGATAEYYEDETAGE